MQRRKKDKLENKLKTNVKRAYLDAESSDENDENQQKRSMNIFKKKYLN